MLRYLAINQPIDVCAAGGRVVRYWKNNCGKEWDENNFIVKQHLRFNMSTIRNTEKHIRAESQSICFERKVISGTT